MIDFNHIENIKSNGFTGFKTVKELWEDRSSIPKERGVYLVLDPNNENPQYITPGVGGFFKGRNPNVSIDELRTNHVPQTCVVYIGKAGSLTGNATLYSRIGQYLRFGQGKNVGHWGGRYIWQLKKHQDLLFCWKITPHYEPRLMESHIISDFDIQYHKRPFANLVS